ncbi:Ornithine carbamoyltransferase [compost metagenome]
MHFLEIKELTERQVIDIFNLASRLKHNDNRTLLSGRTFVLFFPETSLRTRITFEKGIKDLGGECVLFPPETLDKRESLQDVAKYLSNWSNGIIIRHPDFSKVEELSTHSSVPVINAMTSENHPCEIIADLFSIRERRDNYRDLVYTFVGPAGNISRSWMEIAKVMNLKLRHVCEQGNELGPPDANYSFTTELDSALNGSDVVLTDSLPSTYRNEEYISKYQISLDKMQLTNQEALLNPCPPFFRNEEVSEDVIQSDYFAGYEFKKNLIYVHQAIILHCLR